MRNIWQKHKIKIIALLYLVCAAFMLYFSIFFFARKITAKSDEIQTKVLDQEIERERIKSATSLEEDYIFLMENKKVLEVTIGRNEGADLIKKLENMAQETGNNISLKIDEIETSKKQTNSKKEAVEKTIRESLSYDSFIPITIDLKGDYESLMEFLSKLENTHNYINVLAVESKTEKEQEKKESVPSGQFGVFAPVKIIEKASEQMTQKEILHSIINIVVYTTK